ERCRGLGQASVCLPGGDLLGSFTGAYPGWLCSGFCALFSDFHAGRATRRFFEWSAPELFGVARQKGYPPLCLAADTAGSGRLAVGVCLVAVATTRGERLFAYKRTGTFLLIQTTMALLYLALSWPLIGHFGLNGAVIAFALNSLTTVVVLALAGRRVVANSERR